MEPTGCPVVDFNGFATTPPLAHFEDIDRLRALHPRFRSTFGPGFVVFTDADSIRETLQRADLFSSRAVTVLDPNPAYLWIPEMLDAPEHTKWRQLLAPHFSPSAAQGMEDKVRRRCIELIEPLVGRTSIDFLHDFAFRYPTTIFMDLFGMPLTDLDMVMEWEHDILHRGDQDPDRSIAGAAMMNVMQYFAELMAQRTRDPQDDLLTKSLSWTIDGQPIPQDQMLAFCLLMFMAGLDTVSIQLSYSWHHLATHPEHQQRLVNDPTVIPNAVEEFLRAFAFVAPGRTATQDIEFRGVQFAAGDMVHLPLCGATRDPAHVDSPTQVDFDRDVNNHIAFGLGPHRCLGSHLARRELRIALEEWHLRIPSYRLDPNVELTEHGGMCGLDALSLIVPG